MSSRLLIPLKYRQPGASPMMTAFLIGVAVAVIGSIVWRLSDPVESEVVTNSKPLRTTIGGVQFQIPANMFRYRQQRKNRTPERADLFFQWPKMEGYTEFSAPLFDSGDAKDLIFMSITTQNDGMAPEERLRTIYKRFLGAPIAAPQGLNGKRFLDGSGYDGEDLFYEDNKVDRPFIARCLQEDTKDIIPMCLREIKVSAKTYIVYSFQRSYLPDWKTLDQTIMTTFIKDGQ